MKTVKLGSIATIYNGNSINKTVKKQKYMNDVPGWNYVGTKDVDFDGTITYDTGVIIPYSEEGFRRAPAGSVFVCSEGGSAGRKTAIVKQEVCFGNKLFAIVNDKGLFDAQYVYYYTRYENFREQFKLLATSLMGGISARNFSKIEIPLCDLAEQKRIVSRIEEAFSELDSGIETLKKTKELLAVYRQAVIKDAFIKCNSSAEIASVCEHVTDGDHMPPPKAAEGIPFIMISNVEDHIINWSNTAFVRKDYYDNIDAKRKPQKGDVLYTVTGSYGIPILVDYDKEFCFQRHIALLRPKKSIIQKYLYYAMMEPGVYAQATNVATGTAQKTVGLGVLRKIKIPFVENLEEQRRIVEGIEGRLSVCLSIEETVDVSIQHADAMRQSILKQAFEGRL